jgi:hypothetical protein
LPRCSTRCVGRCARPPTHYREALATSPRAAAAGSRADFA